MSKSLPAVCSLAPTVGLGAHNTAAFPLHHQLMEQEDNRGVENVPATRIVYLGESNKKPLFGTQCCRVAGISMVNLTRAVISYTSSLAVYLLPNTNSPQTNIRRTSLVFGITDHMSRDQRASGNSKVSSLPERPAL